MDAGLRKTSAALADGEIVWSWRPDAGAPRNALTQSAAVTTKPGLTGESTYKP
jgi:hypothetical protein